MDMIENPDAVKSLNERITGDFLDIYDRYHDRLKAEGMFSTTWTTLLSRGKFHVPSNDFSCMISREMFNEFQLPAQRAELENLDHSIYHLDGPGAVQHLEALCSLERLDMIQWQPGAGNYDEDWSDLYQRIDDLGKGQFRWLGGAASMQTIRECWRQLKSRKQYFKLGGISRAELDGFLESF